MVVHRVVKWKWEFSFQERLRRGGYLPVGAPTFVEMATKADKKLFRSIITNPGHLLYRHLPRVKTAGYNLRPHAHAFELPEKDDRNFISHFPIAIDIF